MRLLRAPTFPAGRGSYWFKQRPDPLTFNRQVDRLPSLRRGRAVAAAL